MKATRVLRRARQWIKGRRLDNALRGSTGVIHVGANTGQERDRYERLGLRVLWIEPIPAIFDLLSENIASLPRQRAVQALVADVDGRSTTLHVASNQGASSSILDLAEHRLLWPEVNYVGELQLMTVTLPTLLTTEAIDITGYDVLILDTQGSELLILQGAASLLGQFTHIQVEVADFESYAGCAKRDEMTAFLRPHGFEEWLVEPFAENQPGRQYFDVVYRNREAPRRSSAS